jgi:hypothetical protein
MAGLLGKVSCSGQQEFAHRGDGTIDAGVVDIEMGDEIGRASCRERVS